MSMKLMVRILEEANLTRPQSAVLVAMAENANDDGSRCFPSVDLIAWKAGYKPRNVVDIIRDLRAIGVLEMVNKATAQRATEYSIHLDLAPPKQTFEDWKKENGRHSDRAADGSSGVQSHVENTQKPRENAPVQTHEGCNLTPTGVQSHVRGVQSHVENAENAREIAPEPVNEPVNEPVRGTSHLPRNGPAQEMVANLCDVLGIDKPTDYGKSVGQAERLVKAGSTPDEVSEIATWLQADSYWSQKGIDIGTIISQRDKWRASRNAPPSASNVKQFHSPYKKDIGLSNDELEAIGRGELLS